MLRRAHEQCTAGMERAQSECEKAVTFLGSMYVETRLFLENTHLERYAPDHVKQQHLIKRQILLGTATP